jgi:hypothetical protein
LLARLPQLSSRAKKFRGPLGGKTADGNDFCAAWGTTRND